MKIKLKEFIKWAILIIVISMLDSLAQEYGYSIAVPILGVVLLNFDTFNFLEK